MATLKENGRLVCVGQPAADGKKCTDMGPDYKRYPVCRRRESHTPEQLAEMDASSDRMLAVAKVAHDHANGKGLGKGHGGQGEVPCPVSGCGGTISYAVNQYNGHMMGACSKGCASWME
jgi:hypothetical protein